MLTVESVTVAAKSRQETGLSRLCSRACRFWEDTFGISSQEKTRAAGPVYVYTLKQHDVEQLGTRSRSHSM